MFGLKTGYEFGTIVTESNGKSNESANESHLTATGFFFLDGGGSLRVVREQISCREQNYLILRLWFGLRIFSTTTRYLSWMFLALLLFVEFIVTQNGDESNNGYPNYPARVFHVLFNIARMAPQEFGSKYALYYDGFGNEMKANVNL
jgi:hypothetical protein